MLQTRLHVSASVHITHTGYKPDLSTASFEAKITSNPMGISG